MTRISKPLIGSWELLELSPSAQLFAYAHAYLRSSAILASHVRRLRRDPRYPRASVALFLAGHSVELFLKGAILARSPREKLDHHKLEDLKVRFDELYPGEQFRWSMPFEAEPLDVTKKELQDLRKRSPPRDQLYRYPLDTKGKEWKGLSAFEPKSFARTLRQLQRDMMKLTGAITTANHTLNRTRETAPRAGWTKPLRGEYEDRKLDARFDPRYGAGF